MNLRTKNFICLLGMLILLARWTYAGSPNNNLFNVYDILLFKPMPFDASFDIDIAYENGFKVRAYQADPDDRFNVDTDQSEHTNVFRRHADVLELYQDSQDFFAALSGTKKLSQQDTDARLFNIRQAKLDGKLKVVGDFEVPMNLMLAARCALPYNLTLGIYLPVLIAELKNIRWKELSSEKDLPDHATFTGRLDRELGRLEKDGKFDLRKAWKHHGVGDLATVLWWWRDYPQAKQWLKNVKVGARGGLTFPTGSRGDLHKLFQQPFGHDGGVGLLFGGTLELGFGRYIKLGIDGEFLNLFGSVKERRFQTDSKQTDLTFLNKQHVHIDPGFVQHYTLYLKVPFFANGFSSTVAYQHTRQHEDSVALEKPLFDVRTINEAESLQDWTTHSIVWKLDYDPCSLDDHVIAPSFSLFVKNGFNGKRALLFDTVGFQLNLNF